MPEQVLFESEERMERADAAAAIRQVADKLEQGAPITLSAGEESVTVEPPQRPTLEVKVEREETTGGPAELSLELELEWREGEEDEGPLQIE